MKKTLVAIKAFARGLIPNFSGPAIRPPSGCGNINALLLHLCDFDYDLHMWMLRWLAYPLRNHGAKMSTCILVNGGDASGKSMFFEEVIGAIYGNAARTISPHRLQPQALHWTLDAKFVIVDGRYSDASLGHLKHLVSDSAIYAVAASKRTAVLQPNHMNFVFLTGELDFLPADVASRRFVVIEVPPAQHRRFYEAARHEIDNGGVEAFHNYLMRGIDIGDFNATTAAPVVQAATANSAPNYETTNHLASARSDLRAALNECALRKE